MLKLIQAVEDGVIDYFEILTESHTQSIKIYAKKDNWHNSLIILREELIRYRLATIEKYLDEQIEEFLQTFVHTKEQQNAVQPGSNPESHSE